MLRGAVSKLDPKIIEWGKPTIRNWYVSLSALT